MNYRYLFLIASSVFIIFFGCAPKHEQVEINVSKSFKETIEKAAPAEEYCFYAFKESYPKSIKEMAKAKLFVCGEVKTQADLEVVMASLEDFDTPLFKSICLYYINPNVISGLATISEDIEITLKDNEVMRISREKSSYGKDTSIETLVKECFEEMQKDNKNVLLMRRNIKSDVLNQMVEIVFKQQ